MKILIVSNNFPVSEQDFAAAFALPLVREIQRLGHAVTVVSLERATSWQEAPGLEVLRIKGSGTQGPAGGFHFSPLFPFHFLALDCRAKKTLGKLLSHKNFDVALALWAEPAGRWLAWTRRKYGIPFFVWCLGSDIRMAQKVPMLKFSVKKTLRAAAGCFADGFKLAEEVHDISKRECAFMATSRVLPRADLTSQTPSTAKKTFVYMGRLAHIKGVDILIKAFADADLPDAVLQIFGTGSEAEIYRKLILQHNAGERIFLMGYANPASVFAGLSTAHCCVIPSRSESIPVVLSDALQCGCPVLVTRVGDMGTIVDRFDVGIAVEPENKTALQQGIKEMAGRSREEYKENVRIASLFFSVEEAANQFVKSAETAIHSLSAH